MSGCEHTPGPWRTLKKNARRVVSSTAPHVIIAGCYHAASKGRGLRTKQSAGSPATGEAEANARLIAAAPDLLETLVALTNNPHVCLGDLVYQIREREGEGWDGPAVRAWSDAVTKARALIDRTTGKEVA